MDTGTCDRWTDRLSDYLDGELAAGEATALEAHVAGCSGCAQLLRELRAVVATAADLDDAPPAHELWPGIEARLEAARESDARVAAVNEPTGVISLARRRRHFSFTLPQLAAAGVALVALSSTVVWLVTAHAGSPATRPVMVALPSGSTSAAARQPSAANAPAERASATPSEVTGPQQAASAEAPRAAASGARFVRNEGAALEADRQYGRAVADLERLLRRERARLRPETVRALEQSITEIDRAIADARRALARDPANMYLNDHLAESLRMKLELLRTATALAQS